MSSEERTAEHDDGSVSVTDNASREDETDVRSDPTTQPSSSRELKKIDHVAVSGYSMFENTPLPQKRPRPKKSEQEFARACR